MIDISGLTFAVALVVLNVPEADEDYNIILGKPWLCQAKVKDNWDSHQLTVRKGRRKVWISLGSCRQRAQVAWPIIAENVNMVEGLKDDEEEQFLKANPDLVPLYLADISGCPRVGTWEARRTLWMQYYNRKENLKVR